MRFCFHHLELIVNSKKIKASSVYLLLASRPTRTTNKQKLCWCFNLSKKRKRRWPNLSKQCISSFVIPTRMSKNFSMVDCWHKLNGGFVCSALFKEGQERTIDSCKYLIQTLTFTQKTCQYYFVRYSLLFLYSAELKTSDDENNLRTKRAGLHV